MLDYTSSVYTKLQNDKKNVPITKHPSTPHLNECLTAPNVHTCSRHTLAIDVYRHNVLNDPFFW